MADRLPPVDAAETRGRAEERERRAQADWRTAVAGYEQRRQPSDVPVQPVVTHPPIGAEPLVRVELVGLDEAPGGQTAPAGMTPSAFERRPLSAELVDPPPRSAFLESELVDREPE